MRAEQKPRETWVCSSLFDVALELTISSEPEEKPAVLSSIHAIHKPIRHQKVLEHLPPLPGSPSASGVISPVEEYPPSSSDASSEGEGSAPITQSLGARKSSTLSARVVRRSRLAGKLQEVFQLPEAEEVLAEFPAWLFRSILLQGYMYLTTGHVCFYAYMNPPKEGEVVRSGTLGKKGRGRKYYRYWFVLKDHVLSWYSNSTEIYFPDGDIDLRYCNAVEPSQTHPHHFKVHVGSKIYHFSTSSPTSRAEWIKSIKKVIFRAQNSGESVKISIPLEAVVDVDVAVAVVGTEAMRIRVYDVEEGWSLDDYFFAYIDDIEEKVDMIKNAVDVFRKRHPELASGGKEKSGVEDSTGLHVLVPKSSPPNLEGRPIEHTKTDPGAGTTVLGSLGAKLNPFSFTSKNQVSSPASEHPPPLIRNISEGDRVVTTRRQDSVRKSLKKGSSSESDHTYPPATPPHANTMQSSSTHSSGSSWVPNVKGWMPRGLIGRKVTQTVSSPTSPPRSKTAPVATPQGPGALEASYAFLEREDEGEEKEEEGRILRERFKTYFALPDRDTAISQWPAYLFRGLPIIGKMYLSTLSLCFRSTSILASTKMVLPLKDVISVQKHRALRPGLFGLVVVIKGHEEIFFEMTGAERRDSVMAAIQHRIDLVQKELAHAPEREESLSKKEAEMLVQLESTNSELFTSSRPPPENQSETVPPVMFRSTSSSFVTFRPEKSLKFTCLTIGSRGDVQPYIALAKGLIAEGHQVRIASHGEYREWVEGHGIEFRECGGDPAELMKLSVDNGMFSVSFLREGIAKFRGWLDELLVSTWEACQGTEVLIESPSTMAGIHISEALQIPYFRAFTMPWTRTRAYPHAFAVPDHKMGGSYNYMTYTLIDTVFWKATAGQVNRWRRKTLGLGPTNMEKMAQDKVPFLYNFSTALVPPPLDWHEWVHVTGYWNLSNPDDSKTHKWTPPDTLVAFLSRAEQENKKVVYIGFGSIVVQDPVALTNSIVEGVSKAGVMAIVSKGWSDRMLKTDTVEALEESKIQEEKEKNILDENPNIYNVKSIPHDWLFPRIHAAVHHGGAGTTGASLRNGLPTIIRPFFGDQFFWADRVESMGIGLGIKKVTVDNLVHALKIATTDERMIGRAKSVGEQLRAEDGVATAIETIYRDLPYATNLVQKKVAQPPSSTTPVLPSLKKSPTPATNTVKDHCGPIRSVSMFGRKTASGTGESTPNSGSQIQTPPASAPLPYRSPSNSITSDAESWDLMSRTGESAESSPERSEDDEGREKEKEKEEKRKKRFSLDIRVGMGMGMSRKTDKA
ncbi:glycosyltransferase family 1 protein [Atractiella rhizophila]|nr:glycosyltransferase family 1 protein [Atractiella rhizophila]